MSYPIWLETSIEPSELAQQLASLGTVALVEFVKELDLSVGDQLFTEELIAALQETLEGVE